MSSLNLKVLSLNVWNIPLPIICKDQAKRLAALTEHLVQEKYDVVSLQEMWFETGHDEIKERCGAVYPYTKYFARGIMGSGLLVLSRHPIYDSLFMTYAPSGLPAKVHQGDFYGSKGVGLCRIDAGGHLVDVYTTHLAAAYTNELTSEDAHSGHRMAQAVQLMQFVRNTRLLNASHLVTGDLNTMPFESGMSVLREGTPLQDAWLETHGEEEDGHTCHTPDNIYSCSDPEGPKRIDYVLFGGSSIKCTHCCVSLKRVPSGEFNFSDHCGVVADFEIGRPVSSPDASEYPGPIPSSVLSTASDVLVECIAGATDRLKRCKLRLMLTMLVLFLVILMGPSWKLRAAICSVISLAIAFQLFVYVVNKSEIRELTGTLEVIRLQLRRIPTTS